MLLYHKNKLLLYFDEFKFNVYVAFWLESLGVFECKFV